MDKAKWTSLCRRRNFLALVLGFGLLYGLMASGYKYVCSCIGSSLSLRHRIIGMGPPYIRYLKPLLSRYPFCIFYHVLMRKKESCLDHKLLQKQILPKP